MEGRPPRGVHAASAAPPPPPGLRRTHPAPFLCLFTHQECSVVPAGSAGAGGLFPAETGLSTGTGSALSPPGRSPSCPHARHAPHVLCRLQDPSPSHSFPASDLSSDPVSRAHLPCSLQDKTRLVGVCLFVLCSPSDSRDLATSLTTLSPTPGRVQIPRWVTIRSMNGPTSRRDPALGDRRQGARLTQRGLGCGT